LEYSPPNSVVDVDIVCLFKARLDKFWMHEDAKYDFAADLTGIGDRSVDEISGLQFVLCSSEQIDADTEVFDTCVRRCSLS